MPRASHTIYPMDLDLRRQSTAMIELSNAVDNLSWESCANDLCVVVNRRGLRTHFSMSQSEGVPSRID